jgi:hypothetical protein
MLFDNPAQPDRHEVLANMRARRRPAYLRALVARSGDEAALKSWADVATLESAARSRRNRRDSSSTIPIRGLLRRAQQGRILPRAARPPWQGGVKPAGKYGGPPA